MENPKISIFIAICSLVMLCCPWGTSSEGRHDFVKCLSNHYPSISEVVYAQDHSAFLSVVHSSIRNLRFGSPDTPKPLFIITPKNESEIQAVVYCARENGLQIRTRSGGHDYEGLSYASLIHGVPFIVIDLQNMSQVTVDVERRTAWVQAGATIGQLYYGIAEKSRTLTFPAGTCPTVGVGGLFSGGGFGYLLRKYGLSSDNIIDAHLVDVNGRIVDRESMGEDLFWAIRGGGGASFGVIAAWKLQLVTVPEKLTVFTVPRTLEQNATKLFHRWQYVAPHLPEDIIISVKIGKAISSIDGKGKTIKVVFNSLFLGDIDSLLSLMQKRFPELGITRDDCFEVSWIEFVLYNAGFPKGTSPDALLSRVPTYIPALHLKATSDYVQEPIPEDGLEGIFEFFYEDVTDLAFMDATAYGAKMKEIPDSAIPFPHRAGNLFKIMPMVQWNKSGTAELERHVDWSRRLYKYLTPYVSKNPRAAYFNYRDLDLGVNIEDDTICPQASIWGVNTDEDATYEQASIWGVKYFKNNFERLARIKAKVDPTNFFRDEQSIPPLIY